MEAIVKDHSSFGGRGGLTKDKIERITTGASCAIKYHAKSGNVEALRHDLRNGPRQIIHIVSPAFANIEEHLVHQVGKKLYYMYKNYCLPSL